MSQHHIMQQTSLKRLRREVYIKKLPLSQDGKEKGQVIPAVIFLRRSEGAKFAQLFYYDGQLFSVYQP